MNKILMVTIFLALASSGGCGNVYSRKDFPKDFSFGAGASVYQWEGVVDEDGRKPSVWDTFVHSHNQDNGDITSDGYHKYKEDVQLMVETGLDAYRFSISWSRLIPNGRGPVNPKGLQFYKNFIELLVNHGIQPHVTLYHYDHPQYLENEYGGWLNRKSIEDFTAYADVCFREFGNHVKFWTTINEANIYTIGGYSDGLLPPGHCSSRSKCSSGNSSTEPYIVGHNLLLAHASASRLYKQKYKSQLLGNGGEVKNGEGVRKRLKISVAHFDNSALIKNFSKTLLGRCMNPEKQEMPALISNLPKIWKLEERVVGTDLGFGKFQFDFETVEDMEGVLKNQPFHFDYWMLALARWQPKKSLLYPSEIPFWVRIIGVPVEFKTEATFESIGDAIGRTVTVDLDHSRVQVVVDAFKELCFETTIDFNGGEFYDGEEAPVSLRYEKLFGYCQVCGSLCHKDDVCPLDVKNTKKSPEKKREGREGNGVWHDGAKYDDRARSYKGVVINGNANQQQKEREGREYYGKGKGKMGEETDSKWMKVPERGNKRANNNRGTYRGDGEASRYRPARREDSRSGVQSGHLRHSSEQTKQPFQQEVREEVREEGEIRSVAEARIMPPSQAFQVELANTQAEGTTVISDPTDVDRGLAEVHGMQEDQVDLEDEDVMDMDEIKAHLLENGIDMDAEDFLEETAEEETEEVIKEQAEDNNAHVTDGGTVEEEQGPVAGNAEKKPGLRKRLFKASTGTAGSSKLRAFNALASPRKRAAAKPGVRPGDTIKQAESKGASNLKLGTQKI